MDFRFCEIYSIERKLNITLKQLTYDESSTFYYVKYIVLHLKRNKYKKKIL